MSRLWSGCEGPEMFDVLVLLVGLVVLGVIVAGCLVVALLKVAAALGLALRIHRWLVSVLDPKPPGPFSATRRQ